MRSLILILIVGLIAGCVITPLQYSGDIGVQEPWIGEGTPWVYYNSNWYYNSVPYVFYGGYGWFPYGTYNNTLIIRNNNWYNDHYKHWYDAHPHHYQRHNIGHSKPSHNETPTMRARQERGNQPTMRALTPKTKTQRVPSKKK